MPGRNHLWHLVAAGGLLLLTACGDGTDGSGLTPSGNPGTAVVVMQPHLEVVRPGDVVEVAVLILDAEDAVSTPFKLRFDAQSMEFVGGAQGPFLTKGDAPVAFLAGVDRLQPGELTVGLSLLGVTEGVSGDGELCRLRFRILPGAGRGSDYLTLAPFANRIFAPGLREMPSEFRPLSLRYREQGDR
jgi:hypothetical protein